MDKKDYIRLGFTPLTHYTVGDALIFQLGRNRHLSAECVGTPNEIIWICQMAGKDPEVVSDVVCVHNRDYDGYMTEERLTMLIKALTKDNQKTNTNGQSINNKKKVARQDTGQRESLGNEELTNKNKRQNRTNRIGNWFNCWGG